MSRVLTPSLEDRALIDDLSTAYLWALDTCNTDALCACFTDDCTIRHDEPDGETSVETGQDGLRKLMMRFHGNPEFAGHQHREANRVYLPEDSGPDRVASRSYVFTTHFEPETESARTFWAGYYRDIMVRRDGEWKYLERWIAPWKGAPIAAFPGQTR
jgi:hypothetical protein